MIVPWPTTNSSSGAFSSASSRRCQVRFHDAVRVVQSVQEARQKNTWHSEEEYAEIRNNLKKDVRTLRRKKEALATDEQQYCPRGLEHLVHREVLAERLETTKRVVDSVLEEQENQWRRGYDGDDAAIALASLRHSRGAKALALTAAESDAAEAEAAVATEHGHCAVEHGLFRSSPTRTAAEAAEASGFRRDGERVGSQKRQRLHVPLPLALAQQRRQEQQRAAGSSSKLALLRSALELSVLDPPPSPTAASPGQSARRGLGSNSAAGGDNRFCLQ